MCYLSHKISYKSRIDTLHFVLLLLSGAGRVRDNLGRSRVEMIRWNVERSSEISKNSNAGLEKIGFRCLSFGSEFKRAIRVGE